jgi:hypothetical protein
VPVLHVAGVAHIQNFGLKGDKLHSRDRGGGGGRARGGGEGGEGMSPAVPVFSSCSHSGTGPRDGALHSRDGRGGGGGGA